MTELHQTEVESTACCLSSLRKALPWLMVIAWMAVIYYFSDQPNSARETEKVLGALNILIRKFGHVSEYVVLFILSRRAWGMIFETGSLCRFPGICAVVLSVLYALTDEWHQSFVPGRSAALCDVLVDVLGVTIGGAIWSAVAWLRARTRAEPAS